MPLDDVMIISQPDGLHRYRYEGRIAGHEALLAQAQADNPVKTANAFKCGDFIVNVTQKRQYWVASIQLKKLPMRTTFDIIDDNLVPVFHPELGVARVLTWNVPDNMKLYFAAKIFNQPQYAVELSVLFATHSSQGGFFQPPLSNLYDDGRICLGNEIGRVRKPVFQEIMDEAIKTLHNSNWNSDLIDSGRRGPEMFKFDPRTLEPKPAPRNWHDICRRVSHPIMSEVIL